jgi:hypothetical protein
MDGFRRNYGFTHLFLNVEKGKPMIVNHPKNLVYYRAYWYTSGWGYHYQPWVLGWSMMSMTMAASLGNHDPK